MQGTYLEPNLLKTIDDVVIFLLHIYHLLLGETLAAFLL